jgi:hypothetical protein
MPLLEAALFTVGLELDWKQNVAEGTYMKVRNGRIESFNSFTPARPVVSSGWTVKRGGRIEIDMTDERPSRWYGWDGEWIDDDTFVPYVND